MALDALRGYSIEDRSVLVFCHVIGSEVDDAIGAVMVMAAHAVDRRVKKQNA